MTLSHRYPAAFPFRRHGCDLLLTVLHAYHSLVNSARFPNPLPPLPPLAFPQAWARPRAHCAALAHTRPGWA